MIKCLKKERLNQRGACLKCPLRFKCRMPQELFDSNIFLKVHFRERNWERYSELLNKVGKSYIGFITTIQVSHIFRRFNEKINKLKREGKQMEAVSLRKEKDNLSERLENFEIIDFDENSQKVLNDLEKDESLRVEFHDKQNVAVAIWNKLNIQAVDNDLTEDFQTIENISLGFGHKIKLNKEY